MAALSPPLLARAWLRTLVWVIALLLPLQAQARVLMLSCASSHAAMQALQQGSQSAHQLHDEGMASPGHDHQAMLQAAAALDADASAEGAATPSHACSSGCADSVSISFFPSLSVLTFFS